LTPRHDRTCLHCSRLGGRGRKLKKETSKSTSPLLDRAAFYSDRDVLAYLLELGANPNDRADGGSSPFEPCIRHLGWKEFDRVLHHYPTTYQTPGYKMSTTRDAIKLLVQHGAM